MLQSAVQKAAESLRRGQKIQIIKLKSHIGIKGNGEAGRLAHDACESVNCNEQVLAGLPIREHIHWPLQRDCPYTNNGHNASRRPASCEERNERPHPLSPSAIPRCTPENGGTKDFTPDHQVNDLRKGMKSLIWPVLATGYANNTVSIYICTGTEGHQCTHFRRTLKPLSEILHSPNHHSGPKIQVWASLEHEDGLPPKKTISSRVANAMLRQVPTRVHCYQRTQEGTSWEGAGTEC